MPTVKGRAEVKRYIAGIPAQMDKVLRGAGRVMANVVADEAKLQTWSGIVASAIKVRTKVEPGQVSASVYVGKDAKGGRWAQSLAIWEEYGTDPHFISVADSDRQGFSVRKINEKLKDGSGSLVIGGNHVGGTVPHYGARKKAFMRPALDTKEGEAVAAAQNYINARVSRAGITGTDEGDGE